MSTHDQLTRKEFFRALGLGVAATALAGCKCPFCCGPNGKIGLQLYSLKDYIPDVKKDGRLVRRGVGLERALDQIAAIGYRGVEFYSGHCFGHQPKEVRRMLANSGLVACGMHVSTKPHYGFDANETSGAFDAEVLKRSCDFNLGIGNNLIICPGGGNFPKKGVNVDEFMKRLCDLYNRAAAEAAKFGCRIGLHNHTSEFLIKLSDGTTYWDYFFSHTDPIVCMEQDVGWTTCAGDTVPGVDPMAQYGKYPHRSPTLHAKENGMGKGVKRFDAILGKPGCDADGKVCATPVDWDALIPVAEADGVEWWVVECEKHFDDLTAVTPSCKFLKDKGLN